jgi:L-alanine-DL-glutamate epimerase-like enolase superfamily enzyme
MKIQSIETFLYEPVCFVRVTTDTGGEGWGQLAMPCSDITATVLHRQVAPVALGADADDLESLSDLVVEALYKFPGTYTCRALAGLDTALWDLKGKQAGRSVAELLGRRRDRVSVYASSMRRDITPQDEADRMTRFCQRQGFGAVKVKIGKRTGHDQDEWPGRTQQVVAAVRHALGDGIGILVDANSCYTPAKAIEVGRMLEDFHVAHFEEPCPYWEIEQTAQVAAALDIPVAGGEQDFDLCQWRRIFALRAVDIAQPDLLYVGGLTRARRVAQMAQAAGLPCVPHSASRTLLQVFTLHLLAAIPNAVHMEYSIEDAPQQEGLFSPALEVRDGSVAVPSGPGWGVTLNPNVLAASQHQISRRD